MLLKVSFLLNNVSNASTKLSPHMFTFGREPKTPTDVRPFFSSDETAREEDYLHEIRRTKEYHSSHVRSNRGRSSIISKYTLLCCGEERLQVQSGGHSGLEKVSKGTPRIQT